MCVCVCVCKFCKNCLVFTCRYIDVIIYGCRSKFVNHQTEYKLKKQWYNLMLYEDVDSTMLRMIECFMEAAPQLVLQLYILSRYGAGDDNLLCKLTRTV